MEALLAGTIICLIANVPLVRVWGALQQKGAAPAETGLQSGCGPACAFPLRKRPSAGGVTACCCTNRRFFCRLGTTASGAGPPSLRPGQPPQPRRPSPRRPLTSPTKPSSPASRTPLPQRSRCRARPPHPPGPSSPRCVRAGHSGFGTLPTCQGPAKAGRRGRQALALGRCSMMPEADQLRCLMTDAQGVLQSQAWLACRPYGAPTLLRLSLLVVVCLLPWWGPFRLS